MDSQKISAIQKKKRSNAKALESDSSTQKWSLESDSPTQKCFCIVTISVIHLIQKQNLSFIQNHFCQNTYIFSLSFPLIYFPSQIFTNLLGIQKQNLSFNLEYCMGGAILGRLKAVETEDQVTRKQTATDCNRLQHTSEDQKTRTQKMLAHAKVEPQMLTFKFVNIWEGK